MTSAISALESKRCFGLRTSVSAVAWNQDGTRLLAAGDASTVLAFDTDRLEASTYPEQRWLYESRSHDKKITSLVSSPTSPEMFATASLDCKLCVYDMRVGPRAMETFPLSSRCLYADWAPDSNTIAVALSSDIAVFVDCLTWKVKNEVDLGNETFQFRWTPDGKRVLFGRSDGSVDCYDWPSFKKIASFKGSVGPNVGVAVDPTSRLYAVSSSDTTLHVWDAATLTNTFTIDRWDVPLQQAEYSFDGQYLAVIGEFDRIDFVEGGNGSQVHSVPTPGVVNDISWHPKRMLLAYAPAKGGRDRYNSSETGPPICVWGFARNK